VPEWSILVRIACLEELRAARYGFHPSRRGGAQLNNPTGGGAWPRSPWVNCCTFTAQAIGLASHLLPGRGVIMTHEHWLTAMCREVGDPGIAKMVVDMGLAERFQEGIEEDGLREGSVLCCQGWRGGAGHSFFLVVVPAGDGEAELGVMFLEAAGRARGGPTSKGLDGIGSRTCAVPNARSWSAGWWPIGTQQPMTIAEARRTYAILYTAQLTETSCR